MAEKIKIVLALDGEPEFTQGMNNAKQSVKLCDQELKNLKAEYKGNANSMKALQSTQEALKNVQDAYNRELAEAKSGQQHARENYKKTGDALEELKTKLGKAKEELSSMEKAGNTSSKAYKEQKKNVEELEKAVGRQANEFQKAEGNLTAWDTKVSKAQSEVRQASKAVEENAKYLNEAKNSADHCASSIDQYGNKVKEAGNESKSASEKVKSLGERMKDGALQRAGALVTDALAAIPQKAAEAAKYVVQVGSDFEAAMSKVQALSGASGEDLEKLTEKAKELGQNTKFSASEAAEAMSDMALAGWDTNQMLSGMDGVMELAAAGGMDLATAADDVAGYLAAFNMTADQSAQLADIMATAQAKSKTTADQLAEAYSTSATNMTQYGQSCETTTALLEGMASVNDTGSAAGTKLSAVMSQIVQKMKDGKIAIGDQSVAVTDANGNFLDMIDIVKNVETATDGMSDSQKAAALSQTFNRQSMSAMNELLAVGSDKLGEYKDQLVNSSGAAADMAGTMEDNLHGKLDNFNSAVENLGINLYDYAKGPLSAIVGAATTLINGISDALKPQQTELDTYIDGVKQADEQVQALIEKSKTTLDTADTKIQDIEAYKNVIIELQQVIQNGGKLDPYQVYEMQTAVDALSNDVPQLKEHFNDTTGAINMSTEAMQQLFDISEKSIMQEAAHDAKVEAYKALAAAKIDQAKAQAAYNAELEKAKEIEAGGALNVDNPDFDEGADVKANLEKLKKTFDQTTKSVEDAQNQADITDSAIDGLAKTYGSLSDSTDQSTESTEKSTDATQAATQADTEAADAAKAKAQAQHQAAKDVASAEQEAAKTVTDTWDQLKSQAEQGIKLDIHTEFDGGQDETVEKMTENLESQIQGYEKYAENLGKIREYVAEGLLTPEFFTHLESQGTEAANDLQHIVDTVEKEGDSGKEKVKNLSDDWMKALDLQDGISTAMARDQIAFGNGLDAIGSTAEEWDGLDSAKNYLVQTAEGMGAPVSDAVLESFNSAEEAAKAAGVKIPDGLVEGIESGTDDPAAALQSATDILNAAIQGRGDGLKEIANDCGAKIPEGFDEALEKGGQDAVDAVNALLRNIADAQEKNPADMSKSGEKASQSYASGISKGSEKAKTEGKNVSSKAAKGASEGKSKFTKAGSEGAKAYTSGIKSTSGAATAGSEIAKKAAKGADNRKSAFSNAGKAAGQSFVKGVGSKGENARNAGSSIAAKAVSGASGHSMYGIGLNLSFGLAAGIRAGGFAPRMAAIAVASAALQAAKSALGIHSPSRKFRDEVGKQITNGWAFGIHVGGKGVQKEIESVSSRALGKAITTLNNWRKRQQVTANDEAWFWQRMSQNALYGSKLYWTAISNWESKSIQGRFGVSATVTTGSGKDKKTEKKDAETYYSDILKAADTFKSNLETIANDTWSVQHALSYWKKVRSTLSWGTQAYREATDKIRDLQKEIGSASVAQTILSNYQTYYDLSERAIVQYWDTVRKRYAAGTSDRIKADTEYLNAKKTYTEKLKSIEDDYANKVKETNEEYTDAVKNRKQAIMDSYGLFDKFESKSETGETLLFNIKAQAAGYEEWGKSIAELSGRNILSQDLMDVLTEKGPSEIAAIKALLTLTDDQLKEYNDAYSKKTQEAQKQAEKENEGLKASVAKEVKELKDAEAKALAEVNKGITWNLSNLANQIRSIASDQTDALVAAFRDKGSKADESIGSNVSDAVIKHADASRVPNGRGYVETQLTPTYPKPAEQKKTDTGGVEKQILDRINKMGKRSKKLTNQDANRSNLAKYLIQTYGRSPSYQDVVDLGKILGVKQGKDYQKFAENVLKELKKKVPASDSGLKEQLKAEIQKGQKRSKTLSKQEKNPKNHNELWQYLVSKYGYAPNERIYWNLAKLLGLKSNRMTEDFKRQILSALKKKGLQSGTTRVGGDGMIWMDEQLRSIGPEMIVRKADHAILTRAKADDAVIPANLAKNLFKWGAIDPDALHTMSMASLNRRLIDSYQAQMKASEQANDSILSALGVLIGYMPQIAEGLHLSIGETEFSNAVGDGISKVLAAKYRRQR